MSFLAAWLYSLVLLLAGTTPGQPAPEKQKPQGYVNDYAGVLDAGWKQRIERLCTDLDRKTAAQISVVTVRSLEGDPIEDYANRLFRAWGIGRKENKGALLLLVVQDRRSRLEIGYGLEPLLPDGYSGSVLREMRPALGQGQYGEALYRGVHTVALRVAQKRGVRLDEEKVRTTARRPNTPLGLPWNVIFFLAIFAFLALRSLLGRGRGGWFIGGPGMGGWPGAFGGYDSGGGGGGSGGFGGFGGGDSGGGGASSDW